MPRRAHGSAATLLSGLLAIALALAGFIPVHADPIKLSRTPESTWGDVGEFILSPDGRYVVYSATQGRDEPFQIFTVPTDGSRPPIMLHPGLANGGADVAYVTADSRFVVYLETDWPRKEQSIYSVPIAGPAEAAVLLARRGTDEGESGLMVIANPGSTRVLYTSHWLSDGEATYELYGVPITGPATAAVKLAGPISASGMDLPPRVSPDGKWVVGREHDASLGISRLFSVPVSDPPGAKVRLDVPLVPHGSISWFTISPDSRRVICTATGRGEEARELYSVPIGGPPGAAVRLSRPIPRDSRLGQFQVTPDGTKVVFEVAQMESGTFSIDEVYSVPLEGPAEAAVRLNPSLDPSLRIRSEGQIMADGKWVVYQLAAIDAHFGSLYGFPLAGPPEAAVRLDCPGDGLGASSFFTLAPDSERLVYMTGEIARQNDEGVWFRYRLMSAPLRAPDGVCTRLSPDDLEIGGGSLAISPDSSLVVYTAGNRSVPEASPLYLSPITGPAEATRDLFGGMASAGGVQRFQFTPDGDRVVFVADPEINQTHELYSVEIGQTKVGFLPSAATVAEERGGATLTVALSAPTLLPVTVDYAVSGGTATGGSDYTLDADSLTFAPGEVCKTIEIKVTNDGVDEGTETVIVTLSNPAHAGLGPSGSFTLTIADHASYLPLLAR